MQPSASLAISDLWIERGDRDLCKGLAFTLQAGEVVRILGENGAGKSSLLKVIAGILSPLEGKIVYSGEDVTLDRSTLQQDSLYIGHSVGVKGLLTVEENIRCYYPSIAASRLASVLAALGLDDQSDALVKTLSAGQMRRVALARLWLSDKTLWLLDEPFASLDATGVALAEEQIKQHILSGGLVILTTHQDVLSFSYRDVVLLS
ncbi:cytochrome c biogenesis heme-transporting ATPase CcmA [Marinomonas sp. M1K-6]|uniref:Cytochrome c biogenesis heme-transporting ATPase CcmA n=1 Tax=Marinomonas profundi TaxID=2726122 RepID=A0A847QZV8_9GAMM|nr:cytochrome c biogenesis heme-transporting ATPase CcmA [Marinomonas profundi]NLQ16565.1 cytochrome c biogenesis heme-transporting ATPase CcmA [Marinomonas profundi]UDV03848.1 cytochrome c biogenesis heme-transporting ATPase CcmA [Marinomonas profundi]